MKATLDLEPELYAAAKQLAESQKKPIGQVVSELLRKALGRHEDGSASMADLERHNGFDVLPQRAGKRATVESVRRLCAEEGV